MAQKKGNTLALELAKVDGVAGVNVIGFIPFGDFTAEKAGSKYNVYLDPETGKTVEPDTDGAVVEERQASAHRDFKKSLTDPAVVWPDGNMRTLSIRIKANNPINPADYDAKKQNTADERLMTQAASASLDTKRKLMESLAAELAEAEKA